MGMGVNFFFREQVFLLYVMIACMFVYLIYEVFGLNTSFPNLAASQPTTQTGLELRLCVFRGCIRSLRRQTVRIPVDDVKQQSLGDRLFSSVML